MNLYNDPLLNLNRKRLRADQTDAEKKLWDNLRNKQFQGLKFLRQYSVGKYVLDFYCPKFRLAIEIDGGQHNDPQIRKQDEERTNILQQNDIRVVRFWNNEVLNNLEGVLDQLSLEIQQITSRTPNVS